MFGEIWQIEAQHPLSKLWIDFCICHITNNFLHGLFYIEDTRLFFRYVVKNIKDSIIKVEVLCEIERDMSEVQCYIRFSSPVLVWKEKIKKIN